MTQAGNLMIGLLWLRTVMEWFARGRRSSGEPLNIPENS
jgi:hypothetical protein